MGYLTKSGERKPLCYLRMISSVFDAVSQPDIAYNSEVLSGSLLLKLPLPNRAPAQLRGKRKIVNFDFSRVNSQVYCWLEMFVQCKYSTGREECELSVCQVQPGEDLKQSSILKTAALAAISLLITCSCRTHTSFYFTLK